MPYNFAPDSFHTGVTAEALRPLCPLIVNCYVIFHLLGISVKFHDDSFIGCQDIPGMRKRSPLAYAGDAPQKAVFGA